MNQEQFKTTMNQEQFKTTMNQEELKVIARVRDSLESSSKDAILF